MSDEVESARLQSSLIQAFDSLSEIESDDRPSSIVEVARLSAREDLEFNEEELDGVYVSPEIYRAYLSKLDDVAAIEDRIVDIMRQQDGAMAVDKPAKKKRSPRKHKHLRPYYINDEGKICFLKPTETTWYLMYIKSPHAVEQTPKFAKKFRRRFRLPYGAFIDFLEKVKAADNFYRWVDRVDAVGSPCSPIGLLLLGALRYLGRGLTFDDLEEYTSIDEETHRQFFHVFIECGATKLHPEYVIAPQTAQEFETHQKEFTIGGLNGAGFSFDATNVILWNCEHNLRQAHIGFKNSHPARAFNLSSNHRGKILYTTKGHPARWNDKTLAHHDEFVKAIKDGKILQDVVFELLEWMGEPGKSLVGKRKYRGAWSITDNGYHKWSCTQAPAKVHLMEADRRLSDWIESFRKDVECCFGILKGGWRILKTGIRVHGVEKADQIWLTCTALHNMLLEIDGLDGEWEGELGHNEVEDMQSGSVPFALRRLDEAATRRFGSREHEIECDERVLPMIDEPDTDSDDDEEISPIYKPVEDETGATIVNSLSYNNFRRRLVVHFDILHRRHQIRWPKRK